MKNVYVNDRYSSTDIARFVMVQGRSNSSFTHIRMEECVISRDLREKGHKDDAFGFYPNPTQLRQLRKLLETREAELVAAGFLEEEES